MVDALADPTYKPILERFRLDGRTALVTGGGRGIGRALAFALGEAGARVAVVDVDRTLAEHVTAELKAKGVPALAVPCDVTVESDCQAMVSEIVRHWTTLDVAVNNAGICVHAPGEHMSHEIWERVMNVNATGVFLCAKAEGQHMLARGHGSIINTASMSASIVNTPQKQCSYNASKAAVVHLTRSLAAEWAPRGVRVNCISPGYTSTPLLDTPALAGLAESWKGLTPMARLAKVTDLQGAVVFLASSASEFVTGHDLVIDGGYTLW